MMFSPTSKLIVLLLLPLAGCVAPLPVKSVADPWIHGTISEAGVPVANIEVWLDHENGAACERPQFKTITNNKGKFEFDGRMRSWTWVGWANNHSVSGCILGPDGPMSFGLRAVNDPRMIQIDCDIAAGPKSRCKFDCGADEFRGRC